MSLVAADLELAHVRDIEDTGPRPHGAVLVHDRPVLDRHLEAGEGNEACAQIDVAVEQRRPPERLHAGSLTRLPALRNLTTAGSGCWDRSDPHSGGPGGALGEAIVSRARARESSFRVEVPTVP